MSLPRLAVLAAAVLWGTTGTARALGAGSASPAVVGAWRLAVGGAGLIAVALAAGQGRMLRAGLGVRTRTGVLFGVAGVAAYQLCFFSAVARAGVVVGTIVAIGSAPALTGLLALAVRGERPEPRWLAATALAVAGCGLLVAGVPGADAVGGQAGAGARVAGVVLALGAGASYALYTLAAKGLMDAGLPPTAAVALLFGLGALAVSPLLGSRPPAGAGVTAIYLGLVTVVVAYLLYGAGLRVLPASTVASLSLAEPLTAGLLGTLVLGERLTPAGAAGALALLAGLALLVTSPSTA